MSKKDFDQILQTMAGYPEGISAVALNQFLPSTLAYRTLLRRLEQLVAEGKIIKEGAARSTRYRLSELQGSASSVAEGEAEQPLSPLAEQLKSQVNRPLSMRETLGYRVEFLHGYQPNHSYYLSPEECHHLQSIGQQSIKGQPAGTFARKILDRFLIDLSWNSSRLEGNTYSLLETEQLLLQGKNVAGKSAQETQMLLNHKAAIEFMVEFCDILDFNRFTICNLHGFLSDALLGDPSASGRLRNVTVNIHGTSYRPLDIPQLVDQYFGDLLMKASEIKDPFEQAFFILVQIPYLQAFQDVNKRVSRLSANIPFFKKNLCPISFVGVDEKDYIDGLLAVYEMNRVELLKEVFIAAYERSTHRYADIQQLLGEPDPFRLQYRTEIYSLVNTVISHPLSKEQAIQYIREEAQQKISTKDQAKFIEMVENELRFIHEGNFARYRVTPSEFERWEKQW